MENGFFTVDYESMACVVTALVAYNIFSPFSQKIDDLTLPSSPHWVPSTTTLLPIFQNHRLLKNGFYHRFFRVTALFALKNDLDQSVFCSANRFPQHVVDHNARNHKSTAKTT